VDNVKLFCFFNKNPKVKIGTVLNHRLLVAPIRLLCCGSFFGTSLIALMGVGASPSLWAYSPLAFSHRHKAYSNSGLKPASIVLGKHHYKPFREEIYEKVVKFQQNQQA
jgi:hypothetical protein